MKALVKKQLAILIVSCVMFIPMLSVKATTISVTEVSLNKSELEMKVGETEMLIATVLPTDASNQNLIWLTTNAKVAKVVDGEVTAVGEGSSTITVSTLDGGFKATCSITVDGSLVPINSISLDENKIELWEGEAKTLTVNFNPSTSSNKKVIWTSSNTSVATVNELGNVTAKRHGNTTITVTTEDGNKTATCEVVVYRNATINQFTINKLTDTTYPIIHLPYGGYYISYPSWEAECRVTHKIIIGWNPVIPSYVDGADKDIYSIVDFKFVGSDGTTKNYTAYPSYVLRSGSEYVLYNNKLENYLPRDTYTISATLRLGYGRGSSFKEIASYKSNEITVRNSGSCISKYEDKYLASEANCLSPAKYYANCDYCGVNYDELLSKGEIDPNNHACGEWISENSTHHTRSCGCGQTVETTQHHLNNYESKEATCTTEGYNAYVACSDCNFTTKENIPALGCTYESGVCIRCGETNPNQTIDVTSLSVFDYQLIGTYLLVDLSVVNMPDTATLYFATYDESDKMLEIQTPTLTDGSTRIILPLGTIYKIKAFVWEANLQPITRCAEKIVVPY